MANCGGVAPTIILASSSPRRLHLLRALGIEPEVYWCEIDETPEVGEGPDALVARLAESKAEAAWDRGVRQAHSAWSSDEGGPVLIAADTIISLDGEPIGKPVDNADAAATLRSLAGRDHQACTGVAVLCGPVDRPQVVTIVDYTDVWFADLTDDEIDRYVATGEPLGKAGSYTIQGRGSWMIERIEGSYHNVMGLPIAALDRATRSLGWPLQTLATGEPAEPAEPARDADSR